MLICSEKVFKKYFFCSSADPKAILIKLYCYCYWCQKKCPKNYGQESHKLFRISIHLLLSHHFVLPAFCQQRIVFFFWKFTQFSFFFTHNLDCKSLELPSYKYPQSGNLNFLISNRVVSDCKFQEWKNSNIPKNCLTSIFFMLIICWLVPLRYF